MGAPDHARGDALITAHPAARTNGPQLCPPVFNHDQTAAVSSLQTLAELSAEVVLPGHGPAYRGSPGSAVERALARHILKLCGRKSLE